MPENREPVSPSFDHLQLEPHIIPSERPDKIHGPLLSELRGMRRIGIQNRANSLGTVNEKHAVFGFDDDFRRNHHAVCVGEKIAQSMTPWLELEWLSSCDGG